MHRTDPAPTALSFPGLTLPIAAAASTAAGLCAMQAARLAGLAGDRWDWALSSLGLVLVALTIARRMRQGYPHARFGSCNTVTLIRAALAAALVAPLLAGQGTGWPVAAVAGVALALDGVDGWLARRSGLVSGFGARFDMEVDAALAMVLALHALLGTAVGPAVLLLGVVRYGYVVSGLVWPWLRGALPQRFRRKLVCVLQLAALIALQVPALPGDLAILIARSASAAVIWSFAVDILWLRTRRG